MYHCISVCVCVCACAKAHIHGIHTCMHGSTMSSSCVAGEDKYIIFNSVRAYRVIVNFNKVEQKGFLFQLCKTYFISVRYTG